MEIKDRTDTQGTRTFRRYKRWLLLAVCWVAVPVAMLAGLEGGLRLLGYGQLTRPFRIRAALGTRFALLNEPFFDQFLREAEPGAFENPPDATIPLEKDAHTCRVFVFGGSCAYGWFFEKYDFEEILASHLQTRFPDIRFEFFNLAYFAMNSNAMRVLAAEAAAFQPDVFLIYLGNNEMVGPFGLASVLGRYDFSPNTMASAVRANIWLSNLRIGQLAGMHTANLWFDKNARLRGSIDALVGHLDDPRLERVYALYADNLRAMCASARSANAAVVLCTPGANLRDWPPQASVHRPGLAEDGQAAWQNAFDQGQTAANAGQWNRALRAFSRALEIDSDHAQLHYHAARCAEELGRFELARTHYTRALDTDVAFDAANSRINEIVQNTAEQQGDAVVLADTRAALNRAGSHGIPGAGLFFDRVHLTFAGNTTVAEAVYPHLERIVAARMQKNAQGDQPDFSEAASRQRMAYSPHVELEQVAQLEAHFRTIGQPKALPFLQRRRRELQELLAWPAAPSEEQWLDTALAINPRSEAVRRHYVEYARDSAQFDLAKPALETMHKARPYAWWESARLALLLAREHCEQALAILTPLMELYADYGMAHYRLGQVYNLCGRHDAALAAFQQATRRGPHNRLARTEEAQLLLRFGRAAEARRVYAAIVEDFPESPPDLAGLATTQAVLGNTGEARALYRRSLEAAPHAPALWQEAIDRFIYWGQWEQALLVLRAATPLVPPGSYAPGWIQQTEKRLQREIEGRQE